jgi:hypothetical protein
MLAEETVAEQDFEDQHLYEENNSDDTAINFNLPA